MTRYVMIADLNRCVGCQTCTAACIHTNATPPEIQWRKVLDIEFGEYPNVDRLFMPVGCQHCADPPCMHVCPSTATGQRDDGIVTIDYDLCIGCSYCSVACPYQARYRVDKAEFAYGDEPTETEKLRFDEKRIGVAQKCTFCSDRVDDGLSKGLTPGIDADATPGCVNSCIADALHFGDIEDENSNVSELLAENNWFQMHAELGTEPGFFYLWNKELPEELNGVSSFGNTLQSSWDWRAAGNFMFGGSGSALMFFAALAYYPDTPSQPVGLSALAFVGLGLLLVWLEIGRPWRFLNVYFHPQTSWMTREAATALLLFGLSFIGIVFTLPLIIALAGLSGLVFLYCQARILKESKGIPAWREPAIVPLIIATGLCEGIAMLIMLALLSDTTLTWAHYLLLGLLAFRITSWNRYRSKLSQSKAPEKTQQIIGRINTVQLIGGNITPALLIILAMAINNLAGICLMTAGLLTVLSGWHMKFTLVARAAQVQGYALGKPRKDRPKLRAPVRRKPDKFIL